MNEAQYEWQPLWPGMRRKTVAAGEQLMSMLVAIEPNTTLPEHQHPHEQLTVVISGRLQLVVAGREHTLGPGEGVLIPSNAPHSGFVPEAALVVDSFAPPRADLLALDQQRAE
jgi:quercetin dioxygenase-like cupin family protein